MSFNISHRLNISDKVLKNVQKKLTIKKEKKEKINTHQKREGEKCVYNLPELTSCQM